MINIPFIRRQKKNAMKTQKLKSAPGPEVDHQSERNITNNPHKEETRDPLDAMIVEMTVLKTEKEVATLVTDRKEVIGMNATKDPMIEGIGEMTIDTKVAATTRTNTTIMTDRAAAITTDTRLTPITSNKWVAIEAVIEENRTTIEDAGMKEVPAPTTECNRETIDLAVTIMIVATEEVEATISGVVTTTEAAPIVGTSHMTLVDRNAEVDHQGSSNIQEETITAEIIARQRS